MIVKAIKGKGSKTEPWAISSLKDLEDEELENIALIDEFLFLSLNILRGSSSLLFAHKSRMLHSLLVNVTFESTLADLLPF